MTQINSRTLSLSHIYICEFVKVSRGLGLLICCDSVFFLFNTHPLHVSAGSLRSNNQYDSSYA